MLLSLRKSFAILQAAFALAVAGFHAPNVAAQPAVAAAQQTPAQRGLYLAQAGDCISCHTATGGAP